MNVSHIHGVVSLVSRNQKVYNLHYLSAQGKRVMLALLAKLSAVELVAAIVAGAVLFGFLIVHKTIGLSFSSGSRSLVVVPCIRAGESHSSRASILWKRRLQT